MNVRVFVVFSLLVMVIVASCDSSSETKYLEFASDMLLPQAAIGVAYDYTIEVTYGDEKWDASTGYDESGIIWQFDSWKLNGVEKTDGPTSFTFEDGQITGTPEAGDFGIWSFTVTIQKGKKEVVEKFYLQFIENIEITSNTVLATALTDVEYSTYFTADKGTTPYYWSFGNWTKDGNPVNDGPTGLNFEAIGSISGQADASAVGAWTFDVTVHDATALNQLTKTESFELTIKLQLSVPGNFATIQDAVDASESGDTIYLSAGTYQGNGNRDINFHGKSLTILGNPQDPSQVVIDCQGSATDPHRAFVFTLNEQNCVIDGVKIINGSAGLIAGYYSGGAIYAYMNVDLTIQNCEFEDISTEISVSSRYMYGGVIYTYTDCSLKIENTTFKNTVAKNTGSSSRVYGGIIYQYTDSTLEMKDVEISGTNAYATYYTYGGEFYLYYSDYSFSNVNIHDGSYYTRGNRYFYGGLIYTYYSTGIWDNVTYANAYADIYDTSTNASYFYSTIGYFNYSVAKFTNCNFVNVEWKYSGTYSQHYSYGGFYMNYGLSQWEDCVFAGFHHIDATGSEYSYGGIASIQYHSAIFNRCHFLKNNFESSYHSTSNSYSSGINVRSYATCTFNNCVFAYNTGENGSASITVSYSQSTVNINNTTFYKNDGYSTGALLAYGNVNVNNSIFWGNSSSYGDDIYSMSSSYAPNVNNSCYSSTGIQGTINAVNCVTTDPFFKDTGDNPVTGDCTFSDATMTVTGTPGTSAFLSEIKRGDGIYLTSDGEAHAMVVLEVISDSELKVAGYYTGTVGTGAATVKKLDFTPQHTSNGDANDSPCVDSGDNSKVDYVVDALGNARIVDGDGDSTSTVDMGAYEMQ